MHMQNNLSERCIQLMNEKMEICVPKGDKETGVYLNSKFYGANKDGKMSIPKEIVEANRNAQYILVHDDFAEMVKGNQIDQNGGDNFNFSCVFMAQEENFVKESMAQIIVSPRLYNWGKIVDMSDLKDCKIRVTVYYAKIGIFSSTLMKKLIKGRDSSNFSINST